MHLIGIKSPDYFLSKHFDRFTSSSTDNFEIMKQIFFLHSTREYFQIRGVKGRIKDKRVILIENVRRVNEKKERNFTETGSEPR